MSIVRSVRGAIVPALLALLPALGGCVGQQSYDQLENANRSLTERNQMLQAENSQVRSELDIERRNREQAEAAALAERQARESLQSRLDEFGIKYDDLMKRLGGIALDPATDAALAALARQYPDLISYDAGLGMLRFNADLTFASGSDVVSDKAKASLAALARILNGDAAGYDVHIVGHTDAQRISAGTAQKHPTNMHLSCHRAISVRKEFEGLGVADGRMMAAGWGQERPAVPNTPGTGNTPENRRVEIFLRPSSRSSGTPSMGTPASIDREAPPAQPAEINK